MAGIIGTPTKVVDKFGVGRHGFTEGNPQVGLAATQLSSDWCDGVSEEINEAILAGEYGALDNADRQQLAFAIDYQVTHRFPRLSAPPSTWRGHSTAGPAASYLRYEESGYRVNSVNNSVQSLVGMTLPTNSQASVIMRGSLVRSDSMTVYGNCIYVASIRNSAGTYTLQSSTAMLSDQNFIGLVMAPIASGGIYLRFTIPVSVGNVFNIFASISAEVVVWG